MSKSTQDETTGSTTAGPGVATTPARTTTTPVPTGAPTSAVGHSRAGSVWISTVALAVVVIALVVFIAQNSQRVTIHVLGADGHFSLALALLVSVVGGILLVAIPGSLRILQLRHTIRQQHRS